MKPTPAKLRIIIAHVEGSGTASAIKPRLLLAEIDDRECKYQNRGPTNQKLSGVSIDHA
jgi:hypothetical protein